jgi:predicted DNA-binding transcriptional regulator AlpA
VTDDDRLTTDQAAALTGVTPASFRRYVSRGDAPRPDGHFGRTPWWHRITVEQWLASRPGRGAGGGRPPKDGTGSA